MSGRGADAQGAYRTVAALNREWEALCGDECEVADWGVRHSAIRGIRNLQEVLAAVAIDPDEVLGALLREVHAGSRTAARTVLQAMLGKVVLLASTDSAIGLDVYLGAMWERICTYPIERRPRHIAANLAMDARKLARRDGVRPPLTTPWPPGAAFADIVDRHVARTGLDHGGDLAVATAGDVIRAALELQLIDQSAGALLRTVYAEGLPSPEAARRHNTSAAMVRQRCSRAVRRLTEHQREIASYA